MQNKKAKAEKRTIIRRNKNTKTNSGNSGNSFSKPRCRYECRIMLAGSLFVLFLIMMSSLIFQDSLTRNNAGSILGYAVSSHQDSAEGSSSTSSSSTSTSSSTRSSKRIVIYADNVKQDPDDEKRMQTTTPSVDGQSRAGQSAPVPTIDSPDKESPPETLITNIPVSPGIGNKRIMGEPVRWTKQARALNNLIFIDHQPIFMRINADGRQIDNSDVQIIVNRQPQELNDFISAKNHEILSRRLEIEESLGNEVALLHEDSKYFRREVAMHEFKRYFKKMLTPELTGKAVLDQLSDDTIAILFKEDVDFVSVEYYTEPPLSYESPIANGKRITISSGEHYGDVLAFAYIPDSVPEHVRLYKIEGEERIKVGFTGFDSNLNNLVDYIEWTVPHLSNQTYEIIINITAAEHLDENREFISDIFEQVREQDSLWSETINNQEYVRVTFEENLTSINDITIYARANQSSDIEVYLKDGTDKIGKFENILAEDWHKIYLTNLSDKTSDVFDLRVLGFVEFDYIVDPFGDNGSLHQNVDGCGELITENAVYTLNDSISAISSCLIVRADNITIDLAGYNITGTGTSSAGAAIEITNYNNITVKNGNLLYFVIGIQAITSNSTFTNLTIISDISASGDSGTEYGIVLITSDFNNISGINASFCRSNGQTGDISSGIALVSSDNNVLSNIYAYNNSFYGVLLSTSDRNNLSNITSMLNEYTGIYLDTSDYNYVYNATLGSNSQFGLVIDDSDLNTAKNITTMSNNNYGVIIILESEQNNLSNMYSFLDKQGGIGIHDKAIGNHLTNISVNSSARRGLEIRNSDNNKVTDFVIWNCSSGGLYSCLEMRSSKNNSLVNGNISQSSNHGLLLSSQAVNLNSNNNILQDVDIYSTTNYDIYLESDINNLSLINTNYTSIQLESNSSIVRKWYYQGYVKNSQGSPVSGIGIDVYNSTDSLLDTITSTVTGLTERTALTEFINSSGLALYPGNYTATMDDHNYPEIEYEHNLSVDENTLDVFTLQNNISVFLNLPENNLITNVSEIIFNYTATDLNLENCTLYTNTKGEWDANETNTSVVSGEPDTVTLSLSNGFFKWNVLCYDTADNSGWAQSNYSLAVDSVNPSISFVPPSPSNGSKLNQDYISVNLASNDSNHHYSFVEYNNDLLFWMRMDDLNATGHPLDSSDNRYNGTVVGDASQSQMGQWGRAFEFDGDDLINTYARFAVSNNFSYSLWVRPYQLTPSTDIISQIGGSSADFNFRIQDADGHLYFGFVGTGESWTTSAIKLNPGIWNHVVVVYDGTQMAFYVNIQKETPAAIVYSVALQDDSSFKIASTSYNGMIDDIVLFNRSLTDSEVDSLYYSSLWQYSNTFSSLNDGNYDFKGYAADKAGNYNMTGLLEIVLDSTIPFVTLDHPLSNTWHSGPNVNISYTAVDNDLKNCTLYANFSSSWQENETNLSIVSGEQDTLSLELNSGYYKWNALCYDDAGNLAWNSTNRTFYVDKELPVITLNSPDDSSLLTGSSADFNWTVEDNTGLPLLNEFLLCNLTIDSAVNESDILSGNILDTTENVLGLQDGNHDWYITCWDNANNTNQSETWSFTVDTVAPAWGPNTTNSSASTTTGDFISFNITPYSTNPDSYIFSYDNGSGLFKNTSASAWISGEELQIIREVVGEYWQTVRWYWWFNDTAGNVNQTPVWDFIIHDLEAPFINIESPLSQVYGTGDIDYNITLSEALSTAYVSIDQTPNLTMANDSLFHYFNASGAHPALDDGTHTATFSVNDTNNNPGYMGVTFSVDTGDPVFSNASINATPALYGYVKMSINITEPNCDSYKFYWNHSGSFINDTPAICAGGSPGLVSAENQVINPHYNTCWGFWANDSLAHSASSVYTCFNVSNTAPTAPIIYSPHHTDVYSQPPAITYSSFDADQDTLDYYIYIDDVLNTTSPSNLSSWQASDGYYTVAVKSHDSYNYSPSSAGVYFGIDSIPPQLLEEGITPNIVPVDIMSVATGQTINAWAKFTDLTSEVKAVWLVVDGNIVEVNSSAGQLNGHNNKLVNFSYTIPDSAEGQIIRMRIYANDSAGNQNYTAEWQLTVEDGTPPSVVLYTPPDGYITSLPYVAFSYAATDNSDTSIDCAISISDVGSFNYSGIYGITSAQIYLPAEGDYYFNISCWDDSSNINDSIQNMMFTIDMDEPESPEFTVTAGLDGNIDLSWTSVSGAYSYMIFRDTSDFELMQSNYLDLLIATTSSSTFEDNTTLHNKSYWYNVVSVGGVGNFDISSGSATKTNISDDSVIPSSPEAVTLSASGNSVTIAWNEVLHDLNGNPDFTGLIYQVWYTFDAILAGDELINNELTNSLNTFNSSEKNSLTLLDEVPFEDGTSTEFPVPGSCSSVCTYYFAVTTIDDAGNLNRSLTEQNIANISVTYTNNVYRSPGRKRECIDIVPGREWENVSQYVKEKICFDLKEKSHSIYFDKIRDYAVYMLVHSKAIVLKIPRGKYESVDIDRDGMPDLDIKYFGLDRGRAKVAIRLYSTSHHPVPSPTPAPTPTAIPTSTPMPTPASTLRPVPTQTIHLPDVSTDAESADDANDIPDMPEQDADYERFMDQAKRKLAELEMPSMPTIEQTRKFLLNKYSVAIGTIVLVLLLVIIIFTIKSKKHSREDRGEGSDERKAEPEHSQQVEKLIGEVDPRRLAELKSFLRNYILQHHDIAKLEQACIKAGWKRELIHYLLQNRAPASKKSKLKY